MEVQVIPYKRCDVVKITGRIDSETVPALREILNALVDAGKYCLVMDMTGVNFVSSAGWWLFIDTQKNCKRNALGELYFACLLQRIRHSLELVGMDDFFTIFDTVTSAVGNIE
jgi:anti-sigma B factor antagonist